MNTDEHRSRKKERRKGNLSTLSAVFIGVHLWLIGSGCAGGSRPTEVAPEDSPPAPGFFEDRTPGSGLAFSYRNGEEAGHYTILESLGGGVALIDYDGDGLLDVFLPGGGYFAGPGKKQIRGHPCKLFKNLGGFKFRDVTREVGLDRLAGG